MTYATTRTQKPLSAAVSWKGITQVSPFQQGVHLDHSQPWQFAAWEAFHNVGEIRFPFSALSRAAMLVSWKVSIGDKELTDREVQRISAKVHRGIGEDEATRRLILNLLVAGDATYIDIGDQMQVLSVVDRDARQLIHNAESESRGWWRIHLPDPTHPDYGDSSVRAVLGPVADLRWLERLSRANSHSRASTAGIFITPKVEGMAQAYDLMVEAMQRGMADPGDAAALSPIHVEIPDKVDRPEILTLAPELDQKLAERFTAAQLRISVGIDAPAELITGTATINHWGVWALQEDTWRSHLGQLMQMIGDLYAAVHEHIENLPQGSVTWTADPSNLFARKSTVSDALSAHAQHAVSARYVREVLGVGEEAAPGPEDFETWALTNPSFADPQLALETGPPRTGREAGLAAAYAVHQTRARLGAKLRSSLGASAPDVPNHDLVATVGLDRAAKLFDVDAEIRRSLSAFGSWWAQEVGGPAPNLAGFIAATVATPAAELEPIDLDGLSATLAERSQQLLKTLIAAIEKGTATGSWWKREMAGYVADLAAFDLGGDEWTPGIDASAKLLDKLTSERKKALAAKTKPVEASEIARLVCAQVG